MQPAAESSEIRRASSRESEWISDVCSFRSKKPTPKVMRMAASVQSGSVENRFDIIDLLLCSRRQRALRASLLFHSADHGREIFFAAAHGLRGIDRCRGFCSGQ